MIYTEDFFAFGSSYQNDDLVQLVDSNTKENVNFFKTTVYLNGEIMDNGKCDGTIYRKKENSSGTTYYVASNILSGSEISAKRFGVKADGITDDTIALQNAVTFCTKTGWKLILPIGTIVTTNQIIGNIRSSVITPSRRFQMIGAGVNLTIISSQGSLGGFKFHSNIDDAVFLKLSDFSVKRPNETNSSGGIGIHVEKLMEIDIRNIETFKFNTGMLVTDTCSSYFENIKTAWGDIGFKSFMSPVIQGNPQISGFTNPNLLTFNNCHFNSNQNSGAILLNVHNVKFDGCGFEGGRTPLQSQENGLEVSFNGSNGRAGLNIINSYFEGQRGCDVYYTITAGGTANFIGNTFNRLHPEIYSSIVMHSNTAEQKFINFIGNGFLNGPDFQPAADKPAIVGLGVKTDFIITDSNFYTAPTDTPVY